MIESIQTYIDMGMDEESAARQALLDFWGDVHGREVETDG